MLGSGLVGTAGPALRALVQGADPSLCISEAPVSERYELGEEIGCGSYGRAVVARRREDGLQVVVKQIRLLEMDEKARADTLTEAKVLAQFNHVNIVHYYECMLEGGVLSIVMEYANRGDLAEAIQRRQREKKPYSEDDIMFWFVQIVLALYHVHSRNVLHRDLKSQNIFIADGNLLKLGDFGIARVLNSDTELARTVVGSPYYLSPEICEDRPYNRKSDVWSMGCVLYELATLRRAFDGQSLPALVVKILRGKYPPVPTRYSTPLRDLIASMLQQNPRDRPGTDAILRSEFVRAHVERYAGHMVALGLGPGGGGSAAEAVQGQDAAAAAAALGLAELAAAHSGPRHGLPSRASRPGPSRPPRAPAGGAGGLGSPSPATPLTSAPPSGDQAHPSSSERPSAERPSSREASGADTGASTPAGGSSPSKVAAAVRNRGPGGAGGGQRQLVESGWVRKQEAALAELQGALAAQRAGAGPGPGAGAAAAEAAADAVALSPGPSGDGGALDGTLPSVGPGPAGASSTAVKAKLAELKIQREAELEEMRKANAVAREQRKAAAAKRTHESAVAVRARMVERQKEMERHLVEQKAEMEAKARKAMQLAAAIRQKEDAKRKEAEEVAHQLSAHKEQVRAAKARVSKDQLNQLGAQFAARMASAGGAGAADGAAPAQVLVDLAPKSSGGSEGKAPVRQPSAKPAKAGSAASAGSSPARASPSRRRPGAAATPSPLAKPGPPRRTNSGSGAAASDGEVAGPSGRARAPVEPPWKHKHAKAKAGEFPEVQIFTPFGSGLDLKAAADGAAQAAAAAAEDDHGQAAGVLEVLAQIHTVLGVDGGEDGGRTGAHGTPGVRLKSAGSASGRRSQHSPGDDEDGSGGGAPAGGGGAAAAAANALKVEQLRIELERQLGPDTLLAAYRCLRELRDRADDGGDGEGEGDSAGTAATQRELERVLGSKLHLARVVHKLLTLEDAVFS
ncbi:hypothetical protein HYH03_000622 [Edaphochlamys debaryana]|uniref:non-specific serine/threonine protein kinase n=1 Tax=Edaphochlamys debaryana TaxID=47281 RepID=A0A836C7L4_9CHLO|nr:hypothetical protein HYH03_000622 [Edaphochlamys debaryana]|eukprot:KAG2502134.1 hypothetical protein HYH03_000622 [Edaphochlamys debaryana]